MGMPPLELELELPVEPTPSSQQQLFSHCELCVQGLPSEPPDDVVEVLVLVTHVPLGLQVPPGQAVPAVACR
jgi:hypothetical protein